MRVLLLVLALLLAGCGSKDGGDGFETPPQDDVYYVIHLSEDRSFVPAKAKVPTGAWVRFQFELKDCDVRSEEAGGPDSGKQGKYANGIYGEGESFNWLAPSTPKEFNVYCSAHQDKGMTGVIRVE